MADTAPPDVAAAPAAVRWEPNRTEAKAPWQAPPMATMLLRGLRGHCPACDAPGMFQAFLRVRPTCASCGAPLGMARADDAPPYFTILVTGHVIVPPMLIVERAWQPPVWVEWVVWLPAALALALALLQPIKGATVGLMLKLGMLKPENEA